MIPTKPDESLQLLTRCSLFRALDEAARSELASRAHRQRFAAAEPIFHLGNPSQSMMAVISGVVRISIPSAKGREIVLADLGAGEVFGEIGLLDGGERSADATALTNCELLVLERREVVPCLERHPEACLKLMAVLCSRLRQADSQVSELAFSDLASRLAKTLLRQAGCGNGAVPTAPRIKLSLSQGELAKMIGGARESVNRCMRDWQREGLVQVSEGWIILLEPGRLRRVMEPG